MLFAETTTVRTWVSLSCDKLELNAGETATCDLSLKANADLAGYIGTINVSDGLGDVKVTSKDSTKYIVEQQGNSFEVTAVSGLIESNSEVAEIKMTAKKDTKVNKATITIRTLDNCSTVLRGDINLDKKLDYKDIEALLKVVNQENFPNDYDLYDVNGDGIIDVDDLYLLREIGDIYDLNLDGSVDDKDYDLLKGARNDKDCNYAIMDLNFDGTIDVEDETTLHKRLSDVSKAREEYIMVCLNDWADETVEGTNDIIEFKITPAPENVDVPDTVLDAPIWFYVVGAVFMAFGIYLIVESKKLKKEQ